MVPRARGGCKGFLSWGFHDPPASFLSIGPASLQTLHIIPRVLGTLQREKESETESEKQRVRQERNSHISRMGQIREGRTWTEGQTEAEERLPRCWSKYLPREPLSQTRKQGPDRVSALPKATQEVSSTVSPCVWACRLLVIFNLTCTKRGPGSHLRQGQVSHEPGGKAGIRQEGDTSPLQVQPERFAGPRGIGSGARARG